MRTSFLWKKSGRLLLADILLKSFSENFWKISKKTPVKKTWFNNVADYRPETLVKDDLTKDVFLQILKIFQNNFPFENFVRLPMAGVYLLCNKASPKYVRKFAKNMRHVWRYMLKMNSLTRTPHSYKFVRKFSLANPAGSLLFMSKSYFIFTNIFTIFLHIFTRIQIFLSKRKLYQAQVCTNARNIKVACVVDIKLFFYGLILL